MGLLEGIQQKREHDAKWERDKAAASPEERAGMERIERQVRNELIGTVVFAVAAVSLAVWMWGPPPWR